MIEKTNATIPTKGQFTVACQNINGSAYLIDTIIKPSHNAGLVFNGLRTQVADTLPYPWHRRILAKVFLTSVVGTAEACQVIPIKSTNTQSMRRVYLQDFVIDPLLTEAFHNPSIVFYEDEPFDPLTHLSTTSHENGLPLTTLKWDRVVVIRKTFCKTKIAWWLICLLIISPALGAVILFCTHNAEVGIAVSAGVFALATFVQGTIACLQG
ncbi:hypothetical protein MMC21_004190 [Puttea exsequens]|nr:hypothetical protein [Puttea exsequens]